MTEPHAELNAGFVVLFASDHSIFDWTQWHPLSDDHPGKTHEVLIAEAAKRCVFLVPRGRISVQVLASS